MEYLIVIALTVGVTAALSIWKGFVFTKLWMWFVIPMFGLPPISIPMAIGLCLVAAFLTHQARISPPGASSHDDLDQAAKLFGYGFVNAGVILFVGWVVHAFFM